MTDDDDDGNARGMAAWSRLLHIGAHQGDTATRPDISELGIDEVHRVCVRAWKYSRSDFEPDFYAELRTSQWRETCALSGSTAESIMLAGAAYVEAVWHQRAIASGSEPAGMGLAQRYLADGAIDAIVGAGHRLINFVVRVARTSPEVQEQLAGVRALKLLGPAYIPFATDDVGAWLSLNAASITRLRQVVDPALHAASLDALDGLVSSPEWAAIDSIRAENFHRWRKEHEYVVGVDSESGNSVDLYDSAGRHYGRSMGSHGRRHKISDGLTEKTTTAAGDGIRRVAMTLDLILTNTVTTVVPGLAKGMTVDIDDPRGVRMSRVRGGGQGGIG